MCFVTQWNGYHHESIDERDEEGVSELDAGHNLSLTGSTDIEREPAAHSTPHCGIYSGRGKGKAAKNSSRESRRVTNTQSCASTAMGDDPGVVSEGGSAEGDEGSRKKRASAVSSASTTMSDVPVAVPEEGSAEGCEGSSNKRPGAVSSANTTTNDVPGTVSEGGSNEGKSKEGGSEEKGSRGSRSKRASGSSGRFGHRRSPTTGHRVRRHKTPEPNFVPQASREPGDAEGRVKRSVSSPGEARDQETRRMSSSEEDEDRKPMRLSKTKTDSGNKTKPEPTRKISGTSVKSSSTSNGDGKLPTTPLKPSRSKSRGREEKEDNRDKSPWWKSWPGWTQKIRGKSLERELVGQTLQVAPPRRNKSLERPPVIREKEKRAAMKKEKEAPPVPMKRNKSKTRTTSDEERRPSVEESSDEFWKCTDGIRKRRVEAEHVLQLENKLVLTDDSCKQVMLVEALVERIDVGDKEEVQSNKKKSKLMIKFKQMLDVITSANIRIFFKEVRADWKSFLVCNPGEVGKIRMIRNQCISSLLILVIYCGTGAMIFRFTEGAFENFYKCGVKRVKRDFVDALWTSSHNLREEEWKSLARRKLWEFESQLHTAHEAGMTSYSGLKAWSFMNAFIYCLTVVTTIGYGHISPSTTTGRVITIIYAIFGIPMFLILLADFGKLFTRGIKFIWAFVRRVYYTGSCRRVRRTVPVQTSVRASAEHLDSDQDQISCPDDADSEMMKGVQMVYDIATFRRPSQLPPGVTLDDLPPLPQPQPQQHLGYNTAGEALPRPNYSPGEPPGTPALSTYAIDDEFNLPISVAIFILLIYILSGATVFYVWESWGFFESFYFVFISMSTIGFGDVVPKGLVDPQHDPDNADNPLISLNQMYMMASIVYLVFGLALTSMCINVVQEKLSDSFRQASAKIGATIGLRVTEEDGTVTPVAPPPVEIPEVHRRTTLPTAS